MAIAGAFTPLRVLREMGSGRRRDLLSRMADAGLTHLVTEGASLPDGLAAETEAAGLLLGGGIACFSDHAGSFRNVTADLRPMTATGAPRPQMEWYRGIIPTDRAFNDDLVAACRQAATAAPLELFVLDFMRWPLHWELELRDAATVIDSSFDPITLGGFRDEMGVDVPIDDPRRAAELVRAGLSGAWEEFKCRVITNLVGRISREVRKVRPGLPLGAYVVPGDEDTRRRFAGQDVSALAEHVDILLPMAYHAILQKTPAWVGDVVADIRSRVGILTIPAIQATADPAIAAPHDWGRPFPSTEFGAAIDAGLAASGDGFVVFPGHGLDAMRLAEVAGRVSRLSERRSR